MAVAWHRVHAAIAPGNDQSHFQFFIATSAPDDPSADARPFNGWDGKGLDVDDFFIGAGKSSVFWLGLHMFSDGTSTPALPQIRVNYDQPTYLASLPPLYRDQGTCGDFLLRYLSLFESFFEEEESEIRSLAQWFGPDSAPLVALRWLGSWLAIDWDERWSEPKQREVIRRAFDLYGRRGTVGGLREALELFAGIRAVIYEPIRETGWWGLPSPPDCAGQGDSSASSLGFKTVLAGAEPQGAVLGISATLDQSHLIRNEDYGKPLFEQTAHQFSVVLYRNQLGCEETISRVKEILDREKPAHTAYQLCVVDPRMRVGQQSRIGIDAVVAGTPSPGRLGDGGALRLAGEPTARLGGGARLGINTSI
jgi:phage tail-like protein